MRFEHSLGHGVTGNCKAVSDFIVSYKFLVPFFAFKIIGLLVLLWLLLINE